MAKRRKPREKPSIKAKEFLEPIDITQFGTDNDPCFGKLYNLAEPECKRCGDSALCGIVFGQNQNIERKKVERKNRFKDLERPQEDDNQALLKWVKSKKAEGLTRAEIIKKAKDTFGSSRDEIKSIYKRV